MKTMKAQLLLAVGVALVVAGCATASGRWEYRTLTVDNRKGKSVLDNYGKSGWELVNYTCIPVGTNFQYQYVFKRAKK
jgi:hypothetical protein